MIKKAFSNKKEIKEFKDKYSNGELNIQVISNLIQPTFKDKSTGIMNYFKFWFQEDKTNYLLLNELMFMVLHHGEEALKESFGKHDFVFDGNRRYQIYVLDFEGLKITAPSKREVIIPENVDNIELRDKIAKFENAYTQFVVNYLFKNQDKIDNYEKENLGKMKNLGIIDRNNQVNFGYEPTPKKVIKKGI
jgi:hypothetical protein